MWMQPGGHLKPGESEIHGAVRECQEEIGSAPHSDDAVEIAHNISNGVDYTTFLQEVPRPFQVTLNSESTGFGWFGANELPDRMHPLCRRIIMGLSGTELDAAKAVRDGILKSPHPYENCWLFDVRVTGTGTSYRKSLDEYVYRPPENFLADEFVERCNGLPLIFEHPEKKAMLDTEEFRNRMIGVVVLAYVKGDEVWGVAKVYDEDAAKLMCTSHASTSPAVVFRDAGSTESIDVDGKTVLIEGKPSYLDHLAICDVGVWDKGGEPSGINLGESTMAEEQEKAPAWADALNTKLDSVCARMDALEKGKASDEDEKDEREERKADSDDKEEKREEMKDARKDSEAEAEKKGEEEKKEEEKAEEDIKKAEKEGEEEHRAEADSKERKDAQSAAENAELRRQVLEMSEQLGHLTKPLTMKDREALAQAQSRADSVAQLFGKQISAPLHGESPIAYRKRLTYVFQPYSSKLKSVKLDSLSGDAFDVIEDQIYADAQATARSPGHAKAGVLIPVVRRDSAGREITTYEGDMDAWMQHFKRGPVVTRIDRPRLGA